MQCHQRGHSFLKCPNDPVGGKNADENPTSLHSVPLVGINLAVNENWNLDNSVSYWGTSRCDVSNRKEVVDSFSVRRGQKTLNSTRIKPKENWEANADAMDSPSSPGLSTSGTSGLMRPGLKNCDMQQKVTENIAVPKRVVEGKVKWNLQEIQTTGKKDLLASREPPKSYLQVASNCSMLIKTRNFALKIFECRRFRESVKWET